eukprot:2003930-Prymnesium_polylepis.1
MSFSDVATSTEGARHGCTAACEVHPTSVTITSVPRMVAADATVRAAHSRQTASQHRVLDANALSSRDSRLAT